MVIMHIPIMLTSNSKHVILYKLFVGRKRCVIPQSENNCLTIIFKSSSHWISVSIPGWYWDRNSVGHYQRRIRKPRRMPRGNSEFIICVILKLNTTLQSQKAVTAYWKSKQLLPFDFTPSLRKEIEEILFQAWIYIVIFIHYKPRIAVAILDL